MGHGCRPPPLLAPPSPPPPMCFALHNYCTGPEVVKARKVPASVELLCGCPLACCGAETWSPTLAHPCPRRARAHVRDEGPPTTSSYTNWPRAAWTCWTRQHADRMAMPRNGGIGTTGGPCCNARGPCAPCPRRTVAPQSSSISRRAASGRRRRKCGGPMRPWARTPSRQCRPAQQTPPGRRQAPHPTQGGGRSPLVGMWSPTRAHATGGGRVPHQVLALETAPGIRGHFALQPDAPGQALRLVCPVWDIVAGPTGSRDVPGRPHCGTPAEGPAKLAETSTAGDWQEVPGVPGPA